MYVALWGILGNIMEYFVYGYYYVHIYKVYKICIHKLHSQPMQILKTSPAQNNGSIKGILGLISFV